MNPVMRDSTLLAASGSLLRFLQVLHLRFFRRVILGFITGFITSILAGNVPGAKPHAVAHASTAPAQRTKTARLPKGKRAGVNAFRIFSGTQCSKRADKRAA